MAAPTISGGITVVETCDTGGASGVSPNNPLASSTILAATSFSTLFGAGINGTGAARINNGNDNQGGALMGGVYTLAGSTDFTPNNRIAFFHYITGPSVKDLTSANGLMLLVNSGSLGTEEAVFPVNGGDNPNAAYQTAIVNLNRSTDANTYTGSFDPSDVTHIGVAVNFDATFLNAPMETFGYVDPIIVINGETADKGDFTDITNHINTNDTILNESPTVNMHHCFFAFGVGDGATASEFSETLKVFEFARQVNFASGYGRAHLNDNDIGFETNASASDVHDFTLCNWISDNKFYWNSIGSTSATVSYTSCIIQNAGELTIVDSHVFDSCTFDSCAEIATTQPTFSNSSFTNAPAAALSVSDNGDANMTSISFTGNQTAIKVDVVGNSTLNVTEFTFDSSNTFFIEYTGTGTLTVTSPTSIAPGKLNASGGGTITVVAPTTTFTINSSEANSLIQIFTTATQTILASTTGSSLAHDFSGTVVVDYVIQKAGFLPQRFVGVTLTDSSVTVELMADPIYDAAHGLVYITDLTYNRSTSRLTLATRQEGRGFYSALIDAFIAESTLLNTEFKFQAVGPDSIFFLNDAEIIDATSEDNWKGAGIRYIDSSDLVQAEWVSVKSSGTIPAGGLAEFQQTAGSSTTDARATGAIDQIIKTFENGVFDLRTHLVFKYQINGFREERADVLVLAGISTLEPFEFTIAMQPVAINAATGDPAISITITDHGASPVTWNSLPFSITIVDNATNSGVNILREINFNLSLDATYNGKDPFNWPEMVKELGDDFDTLRGITEGGVGAALKGVRVLRGGVEHPDFNRFQSDTGVFFTPAVTANAQTTGIVANSRVQAYNVTAAASSAWVTITAYAFGDRVLRTLGTGNEQVSGLFFRASTSGTSGVSEPAWDTVVGNTTNDGTVVWTTEAVAPENSQNATDWSLSYTDGEEFSNGDEVRVRVTYYDNTPDYKLPLTVTVIASSTGFTALISQEDWVPVNAIGIDGGAVSEFTLDSGSVQIDIDDPDGETQKGRLITWYAFELWDNPVAIDSFYGAILVEDQANYRLITAIADLKLENVGTQNVLFTDIDTRLYRDDGATLLATTGTASIEIQSDKIFVAAGGGGGGDATEANQNQILAELGEMQGAGFDTNGNSLVDVTNDIAVVDTNVDAILVDTGTTIPAQIAALNDFDPATDTVASVTLVDTTTTNTDLAAVDTKIDAIKAKTDDLTFTKANELDSNIQSVDGTTITGSGTELDPWGP